MTDPRYRYPAGTRRQSPPMYNPARASLPVVGADSGYDALYAGDMHGMSSSHHGALVSRPAGEYEYDYRPTAVPVSTTTYAVRKDPIPRSTSVKESGGRSHRSSTLDGASKRPIIITTKHGAGAEATSSTRNESPTRDGYRMGDEANYYAEPASSINRTRSTTRAPFSAALDDDEYRRLRERTEMPGPRGASDQYRPSRGSVMYSATTPHRGDTREYDDDGYEYTRPSDLARYDLDNHHQPRRSRRDSQERYYRPTVSVATGLPYEPNDRRQRGPPPTTWGLDKINRVPPAAGLYDGAGIRMPVPPAVPLAPEPSRRGGLLDVAGSPPSDRRVGSRPRPVSLIQDTPSRSSRADDDYYRPRDDDMLRSRDLRDRGHEYIPADDGVTTRGFGIRIEPEALPKPDERAIRRATEPVHRDHREDRRDDRHDGWNLPREYDDYDLRRSDDDLDYGKKKDRDDKSRRGHRDRERDRDRDRTDDEVGRDRKERVKEPSPVYDDHDRKDRVKEPSPMYDDRDRREKVKEPSPVYDDRDRKDRVKEPSPVDDDRDTRKDKVRDKVVAGLGVAAASLGLGSVLLDKDEKGKEKDKENEKDKHAKHSDSDRLKPEPETRSKHSRRDSRSSDDDFEIIELPRKDRERSPRDAPVDKEDVTSGRHKSKEEPKPSADAASSRRDHSSSSDDRKADEKGEERASRRRRRAPSAFNPNDTATLAAIKAQLAAAEEDKKPERADKAIPTIKEPSPERDASPASKTDVDLDSETGVMVVRDDSRGRELDLAEREERQVRVVSPPREKDEKKPIKGILKQPKPQFPEEPNPIREGVAPHKDDKTKADVPSGARWTKINRKMVNPEALTIGKERFEVRDDFVIVLRVLSKEEIQAYADATQILRERRRKEYEREVKGQDDAEYDQDGEEEKKRRHRHRREKDRGEDEVYDEEARKERHRDRDRDRGERGGERYSTRNRYPAGTYEDEEEYKPSRSRTVEYHGHGGGHHRSHRDRDRERERERER
ncbi:hypothetical protein QBC37DRAFT_88231 [Rhypophila decipiens]|uniref:DUF8035 domain-containing protein n=1 Tax=Rhypophila decipiens TaxID=261697 RepID=A0AAN6YH81_9PEZI|nr:hypothetical protein QBC37DRAFT_88231 [Rhypophila decipiens]